MTNEEKLSLEQAFVENYFDFGDDNSTNKQNLDKANELYVSNYNKVEKFAIDLSDGLMIDQSDAILAIQILCLSHKYKDRFQEELDNSTL